MVKKKGVNKIEKKPAGTSYRPQIILSKTHIRGKDYYFPTASFDPNSPAFSKDRSIIARSFRDSKDITKSIAPVQFPRIRIDLDLWRQGILEAELPLFPFRTQMQQIYQDLILDGHIEACMRKRRNMTLLKEPCFYDAKGQMVENNPFLTEMINSVWWMKMIRFALDADAFGYQLISLGDNVNNTFPKISIVRRQNISPDRHQVMPVVNMLSGIDFTNPEEKDENGESFSDWHLWRETENEVGMSKCGYGYLYKCATYGLYIRNMLGANADFIEVFGSPARVVKTTKKSKEERDATERDLQNMGAMMYLILDPEDEFEFMQAPTIGTSYRIYSEFEARCKKYISAIILGHEDAMATQPKGLGGKNGSSTGSSGEKSDSEIQKSLSETEAVDTKSIISFVNDVAVPLLRDIHGFPIPRDIKYGYKNNDELDEQRMKEDTSLDASATWILKMSQAGYELSPEEISERMGITVTAKAPAPDFNESVSNKLKRIYKDHGHSHH